MGVPAIMAAGIVALAAGGAYAQWKGTRDQAKLMEQGARLKAESAQTEAGLVRLQAREQEAERLRRAGINEGTRTAAAAGAGFDWFSSPGMQSFDAEQDRIAAADISSIRLLGGARQRRMLVEGRGSEMTANAYGSMASNAWIAPTVGLLQRGFSAYQAGAPVKEAP